MDSNAKLSPATWQFFVPLLAASLLALVYFTQSNILLFQWLNHFLAFASDGFWSHLTMLGDTTVALLLLLPFVGRRPDVIWKFVLAALFASLWSHGMKALFSSARPAGVLPLDSFHQFGPLLQHNAFPSGHTTTIFALAGLLCLHPLPSRWKSAALSLALLVGLSRIACGAHWPLDVLGGMLGGWLSALAGVSLAQRWQTVATGGNFQRGTALLLLAAAFWTVFRYHSGFPNTQLALYGLAAACVIFSLPGVLLVWQRNT